MKISRALVLISVIFLFSYCTKEKKSGPQEPVDPSTDVIIGQLQGNVYDDNGQPAQGVAIKLGSKNTTTDARGNFRFDNATMDKKASQVTAELNGFFKAYRIFAATSGTNYVSIKLIKKSLVGTIDATSGGTVSMANGAKISLPSNGVVKASSTAFAGTVNVYASYIDPTAVDISQTVPGSFLAEDLNGKRVTMASFGMMAVELESSSGEKLQIKSGSVANLTTPIPSSALTNAPATIAMWSLNEQTGIWKEEGTATKSGNVYVADVKHFTYWNCDLSVNSVMLSLTLNTPGNQPIVHAQVRIKRITGVAYQTSGWTDSLGQTGGYVPANENLILEILDPCNNVVLSQNIGPFTQNTNLGVLNITIPSGSLTTITGHLSNCGGNKVTSGYAIVYYNNTVRYAYLDNNGNFSTNIIICNGSSAIVQVLAIDNTGQQQSNLTTVNVSAPATNVGNITACGNPSAQYINYTLDGVNYAYTSAANDTLTTSTQYTTAPGVPTYYTNISGFKHDSTSFFAISCAQSAPVTGIYYAPSVFISDKSNVWITTTPQSYMSLTNYPQVIGQFYEGTFNGSYSDASGFHTLSGSFKARKNF